MSPEKKTPRITKSLGPTFSIHFSLATSKLQDRGESVLRKVARKPQESWERRVPHSGTPAFGVLTICTEISVKNFRQMVLVFFWHRKQGRDWVVPFTKYWYTFRFLSTWSLALVIQTNGTEHFGRFVKTGKRYYLERYYFFPGKFPPGWTVHLNSPRNSRVFHPDGKRSWYPLWLVNSDSQRQACQ